MPKSLQCSGTDTLNPNRVTTGLHGTFTFNYNNALLVNSSEPSCNPHTKVFLKEGRGRRRGGKKEQEKHFLLCVRQQ